MVFLRAIVLQVIRIRSLSLNSLHLWTLNAYEPLKIDSHSYDACVVGWSTDADRNWYGGNQLVSTTATSRQQVIKGKLSSFMLFHLDAAV